LALLRVPVRLLLRALARDPLLLRDVRPRADLPPDPASRSIMPGAPEADSVSSVSSAMFSVSRLPDPVFRAIASFLHSRAQWNETPEA
jgi:hypothetical protein